LAVSLEVNWAKDCVGESDSCLVHAWRRAGERIGCELGATLGWPLGAKLGSLVGYRAEDRQPQVSNHSFERGMVHACSS
jgi:hypothetical protein